MVLSAIPILIALAGAVPIQGGDAYLAARKAERAAKYGDAAELYDRCVAGQTILAPYAQVRKAYCRKLSGDRAGAELEYRRIIAETGEGPWIGMAKAQLAMLYQETENHAQAAGYFRDVLSVSLHPWWFEEVRRAGSESLLFDPSLRARGLSYFRDVARTTRYLDRRKAAAELLAEKGDTEDQFLAVLALIDSGLHKAAEKQLLLLMPKLLQDDRLRPQWQFLQGRVLTTVGDGTDGRLMLESVVRDYPETPWAPQAMARLLRYHEQNEQEQPAQEWLARLETEFANSEITGETLWWLAQRRLDQNRRGDAFRHYYRLAEVCPHHDRASEALLRAGHIQREDGSHDGAVQTYRTVISRYPRSAFTSEAAFWSGILHVAKGESDDAANDFRAAKQGPLGNFYTHRGIELLRAFDGDADAAPTSLWADSTAFVSPSPLDVAPPEAVDAALFEDERLQRLQFFARHGLEEAEWEGLFVIMSARDTPQLGVMLRVVSEAGVAHSADQMAAALEWGVAGGVPSVERQRLRYARAYWPEVERIARETGVDPYLILSVARQESTYRPALTSRSGARGVMQVMPGTARYLVNIEPNLASIDVDNLEDPVESIRLGAYYLRRMIARSNGNLVFALASYNAGPGNCDKWRKSNSDKDIDGFIESIGFRETKDYVRKVLGNYAAYHSIYP